jgi:hypothetical protein
VVGDYTWGGCSKKLPLFYDNSKGISFSGGVGGTIPGGRGVVEKNYLCFVTIPKEFFLVVLYLGGFFVQRNYLYFLTIQKELPLFFDNSKGILFAFKEF